MDLKRWHSYGLTAAILIAAVLIPIAMKLVVVGIPPAFLLLGYANPVLDGFSKIKGEILLVLAPIAFGFASVKPRLDRIDAVIAALAALMTISAFASPYAPLALTGVPYIFEDIRVDLAYLLLFFAARRLPILGSRVGLPMSLGLGAIIAAWLGLSEAHGHLWVNESPLRDWIFARGDGTASEYLGNFGAASLPFGNPNYVGLYGALIWPYFCGQFLTTQRMSLKALSLGIALISFAALLVSLSRGGLIGASSAIVGWFFYRGWRGRSDRIWWRSGLLLALAHGGFWLLFYRGNSETTNRIASIAQEAAPGHFLTAPPAASQAAKPPLEASKPSGAMAFSTTRLFLDQGRMHLEGDGPQGPWGLLLERAPHSVKFMDLTYKPLLFAVNGEKVVLQDSRYGGLDLTLHTVQTITVLSINGKDIAVTPRGFRLGYAGAFIKPRRAERFPLPIADDAFSQRGRIWSYSLPLLGRAWLKGYGPGAFPHEFPNNDPILMSTFGPNAIVDKPHNSYIGFAVAHGILALCLLLGLIATAMLRAAQVPSGETEALPRLPLAMGLAGFAIAALTVDSTVGVSTLFWILLGTLFSQASEASG